MNTIYWLAAFGMLLGYGLFTLSALAVLANKEWGSGIERIAIEHYGAVYFIQFRWLLIGIVSTIVFATV